MKTCTTFKIPRCLWYPFLIVIILLSLPPALTAQDCSPPVNSSLNGRAAPKVYDNCVVWEGQGEILLYDKITGITNTLTENDYDDIAPQVCG
jgi:hypothetical protein